MSGEIKQVNTQPPPMLKPRMSTASIAYAYWDGMRISRVLPWPPPVIMLGQRQLNQRRK